jgi:hypothetical protein
MEWTEDRLRWLESAKAQDISKVFAKQSISFQDKMAIQKKWLEIHETKRNSILKEASQSSWWNVEE